MRATEFTEGFADLVKPLIKPFVRDLAANIPTRVVQRGAQSVLQTAIRNTERQGVQLVPMQGQARMVQISGRPIVVVNVDGINVPFYVSTGLGQKANVPVGRWYVFWGIGSDGWFNKHWSEQLINSQMGNSRLQSIARVLDQAIGDARVHVAELPDGQGSLSVINRNMRPTSGKDMRDPVINQQTFQRMENMGGTL